MNQRELAAQHILDLQGRANAWRRAAEARRSNADPQPRSRRRQRGRAATFAGLLLPTLTVPVLSALPVSASTTRAARIDPGTYTVVNKTFDYQAPAIGAGGYLSCPAGTKAVSSGAISNDVDGELRSSLTTFDGDGAYITSTGRIGYRFEASVRCVKSGQVAGSTLATTTVHDNRPGFRAHVASVHCPAGSVAYGGGAFVKKPGSGPQGGLATYSLQPTADGSGWTYAGVGELQGSDLVVSTHCLFGGKFGPITVARDSEDTSTSNHGPLVVGARCPAGYLAYAGGARLARTDSANVPSGWLTSSSMTADNRGWYASALSGSANTRLTAFVRCTLRPLS